MTLKCNVMKRIEMDTWISYNKLVDDSFRRFGYFSFHHLSDDEQRRFKHHLRAFSLWKNYRGDIPYMIRNITSTEALQLADILDLSHHEIDLMNQYTISELKHLCHLNHVVYVGNKKYKKSWARALIASKHWSFNVFAMRTKLDDDVLSKIKCWLG